ncbi:DUF4097 domain-containing protein [Kitasatospora sp. NBC_00240]|uniref:DUF4097 family beta strand repeat-containing protein n=1 Tax=Kitasatospora sp. NBC_00240 TaxID=2903567 RepID=UPI0022509A4B|nr:DUF4097 family beta strand repeat-containing protein [Kitasatospora sp. NBC_00240]MCX5213066.1 DUF4097 domain-containing protein [Kitasatospora sp. NBC_00240]
MTGRTAGEERTAVRPGAGPDAGPGAPAGAGTAGERRVWRLAGGLVMAVVLMLGASQAWAALVQQHTSSVKEYQRAARVLALDTGRATVRIEPGRSDRVVVRAALDWTLRQPQVSMLWDDDVLRVSVSCNRFLDAGRFDCGTRLVVEVPADTRVTGRNSSGHTEVRGLTGDVQLRTASGSVRLAGLSGRLTLGSTSGVVRGEGLTSPAVEADTASGTVDLSFAAAPASVVASSTSGSLSLTVPAGSRYRFTGRAGSGGRSIDPVLADSASPRTIEGSTTSGSMTVQAARP